MKTRLPTELNLIGAGSVRDRERLPKSVKAPVAAAAHGEAHVRRAASVRSEKTRALPTSPLAAGIVRQQSVATPTGGLVQRTIISHPPPTLPDDAEPADGCRGKPRLTRQIAVSDEAAARCVSFEPVRPHGVWHSSVDGDDADEGDDEAGDDGARPKDRLSVPPVSHSRHRLALAGFVPRKLSTISSRSCSVNPDGDAPADAQCDAETRSPLLGPVGGQGPSSARDDQGESPL